VQSAAPALAIPALKAKEGAMTRTIAAFAALLVPAAAAPASSVTAASPHDPKLGCKAIDALVANLSKGLSLARARIPLTFLTFVRFRTPRTPCLNRAQRAVHETPPPAAR
jgi:hypothetical protein